MRSSADITGFKSRPIFPPPRESDRFDPVPMAFPRIRVRFRAIGWARASRRILTHKREVAILT